jgi:hypothetical protein
VRTHNGIFGAAILAAVIAAAFAFQEPAPKGADPAPLSYVGERLVYKVEWDPPWYFPFLPKMEAGEAELALIGDAEYNGRKLLKILFKGHSSGTLAKIAGMKIEDEFVFFIEPETFCTLSASSKIREGKRKRQVDVQYLRETRQLHIREVDEASVPPVVRKDETKDNIPKCIHDPFSALYLFRSSGIRENHTRVYMLANDDKIREVKAIVEKQEILETKLGKRAAWRVGVAALMGGLFKEGGQFKIWFSADEKKVPLQFEVKVQLGRVFGRLKQ